MITRDVPRTNRCREALVASGALLFIAAGSGGCVAAGMAAVGPVLSAVQALADRTVERTLPADLSGASAVTLDTVSRLGFRVRGHQQADEAWTFEASNDMCTIHGLLTPLSPSLTRLSLRVEVGSLAADKSTGEELLNQIAASLSEKSRPRASSAVDAGGPGRLAELEAEIQRLRLEIEAMRTHSVRPPARENVDSRDGAGKRQAPGVISIPASYGVPAVTAPAPVESPKPDRVGVTVDRAMMPSVPTTPPLAPANGLRPIQPFTEKGSGGKE